MDKIDKIYYINLSRRTDRNTHFLNGCTDAGIPMEKIERFEGLDGQTYKPTREEILMFKNCDYIKYNFYNNILCNQLGHYYLLKKMIEMKYNYVMICQDDIIFRNDFVNYIDKIVDNLPVNCEIMNIGFHAKAQGKYFEAWDLKNSKEMDLKLLGEKKINDYVCVLKNNINPCSLAYIVTYEGAVNLVKYFDTKGFARATDGNYNDYCIGKNIFYGSIPVLCTGNPKLGSDIF